MLKLNHIHNKLISVVLIVPALLSLSVPVSTVSAHQRRITIHRVIHSHRARNHHRYHSKKKHHNKRRHRQIFTNDDNWWADSLKKQATNDKLKQLDSTDIEDPSSINKPYNNLFAKATRADLINDINSDRIKYDIKPLEITNDMQRVANQRIQHVVYFASHYNPHKISQNGYDKYIHGMINGESVEAYSKLDGYNTYTGENAGKFRNSRNATIVDNNTRTTYDTTTPAGTAYANEDSMMNHDNSSGNGHRINLLDKKAHHLGVATYNHNNYTFITEDFQA